MSCQIFGLILEFPSLQKHKIDTSELHFDPLLVYLNSFTHIGLVTGLMMKKNHEFIYLFGQQQHNNLAKQII